MLLVWIILLSGPTWAMCPPRCHCNEDALQVTCSAAGLQVVPIQLNPEVRHIDLFDNKINSVHYTFSFYTSLVSLNLSANKIQELGSKNFETQKNLKFLNLSSNEIENITKDSFKGLHALVILDLSGNHLKELPPLVFRDLHSLEILKLTSNMLIRLEDGLLKPAKHLKELYLDDNQLIELPGTAICDASALQRLTLSQNLLENIEEKSVPALPELRILQLDKNIISEIQPGALSGMSALIFLDISDNNFTAVPTNSLAKLSNLTKLKISGNFISFVPPVAFRGLFQLKYLSLDRLEVLTKIDSRAFVDNINLERIRLDDNIAIESLPMRLFHGNPKIAHVSVRNNQLKVIDATHFPIDQLKTLKLGGNPWNCNCSLNWLWKLSQDQLVKTGNDSELHKLSIDVEDVICNEPEPVKNVRLLDVKYSQVNCSQNWITTLAATLFVFAVFLTASVIYYGHTRRRLDKTNLQPRENIPCTNTVSIAHSYEDGRADKCKVTPPIIHNYQTLTPWDPFLKQQEEYYRHFDNRMNVRPHIVYV